MPAGELSDDSATTVEHWMPPEDELRRLYVEERCDSGRIGAHYGFSRTTVYDWLRALGIRGYPAAAAPAVIVGADRLQGVPGCALPAAADPGSSGRT